MTVARQGEKRLLEAGRVDLDVARVGVGAQQRPDRDIGVGAAHDHRFPTTLGAADARQPKQLARIHARQGGADRARADPRPDLGGWAVGDDGAVRHQHGAIRISVGLLEVVSREHDRLSARGKRPHRPPECLACLHVERDGGLIEHEQLRVADERDREPHALSLSA